MTVAATDTWSETRDEIISDALTNVGALGPGKSASGATRDFAVRALNRLVKAIDAEGAFLWRTQRLTTTTVDGTAAYTLDATVFAVDGPMRYTRSGQTAGTPIEPISIQDYMKLSDRTTEGQPSRYLIEKTLSGAGRLLLTARLWPVPDATGDTLEYAGAVRAKDLTSGADTSDFPTNWIDALVLGLTASIAPGFAQAALGAQYQALYLAEKDKQMNVDNEQQDLWLVPRGGF